MAVAEHRERKIQAIKEMQFRLEAARPLDNRGGPLIWPLTFLLFVGFALMIMVKAVFGVIIRWLRMLIDAALTPFVALYHALDLICIGWWYFVKLTRKLRGE